MYKDIHIQRVVLFFRLKSAHFPVNVIRVATRHLMIIRHDVNTKRDTTMGLGTDVHVERLSKISLLLSVFVVLGKSGPPISQIIMSGLLSTMMLAPIAGEFGLNLTI